jgi:hypothetical protein
MNEYLRPDLSLNGLWKFYTRIYSSIRKQLWPLPVGVRIPATNVLSEKKKRIGKSGKAEIERGF